MEHVKTFDLKLKNQNRWFTNAKVTYLQTQ